MSAPLTSVVVVPATQVCACWVMLASPSGLVATISGRDQPGGEPAPPCSPPEPERVSFSVVNTWLNDCWEGNSSASPVCPAFWLRAASLRVFSRSALPCSRAWAPSVLICHCPASVLSRTPCPARRAPLDTVLKSAPKPLSPCRRLSFPPFRWPRLKRL